MNAVQLRLYTQENRTHRGRPLYQWLLERARALGIGGGSAFKALAGYGRHGRLHEQHFFELDGEAPVLVEFVASAERAQALLDALDVEALALFYTRTPVESGTVGAAAREQGA